MLYYLSVGGHFMINYLFEGGHLNGHKSNGLSQNIDFKHIFEKLRMCPGLWWSNLYDFESYMRPPCNGKLIWCYRAHATPYLVIQTGLGSPTRNGLAASHDSHSHFFGPLHSVSQMRATQARQRRNVLTRFIVAFLQHHKLLHEALI